MTLKDAEIDQFYVIRRIAGGGALKKRVMDMGLTRGTEIYVRKVAPLGDPIQINARGYELSLRKADAEIIQVEAISK